MLTHALTQHTHTHSHKQTCTHPFTHTRAHKPHTITPTHIHTHTRTHSHKHTFPSGLLMPREIAGISWKVTKREDSVMYDFLPFFG